MKNSPILLLDEATSALDNATEKRVKRAIDESNQTVFMIAHRLSTISGCDMIMVIELGRLIESGTHD